MTILLTCGIFANKDCLAFPQSFGGFYCAISPCAVKMVPITLLSLFVRVGLTKARPNYIVLYFGNG